MLAKISLNHESPYPEFVEAVRSLRKQSVCGCVPKIKIDGRDLAPGHADGCGVGYVCESQVQIDRRAKQDCWDTSFVDFIRNLKCQMVVGHNRKASSGLNNVGIERAHPFQGGDGVPLAFCHNGTISGLMPQAKLENITDSEIFLRHILRDVGELNTENLSHRISELARQYKADGGYTSLTALLLTPVTVFAWRVFQPTPPPPPDANLENVGGPMGYPLGSPGIADRPVPPDWRPGYYTLWVRRMQNQVLIASEATDAQDYDPSWAERERVNGWELMNNDSFCAVCIRDGDLHVETVALSELAVA
jgi:hypothetical protein